MKRILQVNVHVCQIPPSACLVVIIFGFVITHNSLDCAWYPVEVSILEHITGKRIEKINLNVETIKSIASSFVYCICYYHIVTLRSDKEKD